MDWDAIGAVGEILGAAGVIMSLVYLGTQIRQNSQCLKASIIESAGNRTSEIVSMLIVDTVLSSLVRKGLNDKANDMSSDEAYRFSLVMLKAFRGHEITYAQHRSGLLDNLSYEGFVANMTLWMNSPHFEGWWESTSTVFSNDFKEMINELKQQKQFTSFNWIKEQALTTSTKDGQTDI